MAPSVLFMAACLFSGSCSAFHVVSSGFRANAVRKAANHQVAFPPLTSSLRRPIMCSDGAEQEDMRSEKVGLVERASDPFRVVRVVLYVTFGVVGIAGLGIAITQMGSDPMQSMGNLAINALVLAAGVGLFFFDQNVVRNLRDKAEKESSVYGFLGDEQEEE